MAPKKEAHNDQNTATRDSAPKKIKGDDDIPEDLDEEPTTILDGTAVSLGAGDGGAEVQGLLLELIAAIAKLSIMLAEMDAEGFDACHTRLGALRALVASLPDGSKARRRVLGFKGTTKTSKKGSHPRPDKKLQDPRARKPKAAKG